MNATILVSSWDAGVFVVSRGKVERELADCSVGALTPDGRGGALAIVDKRSLRRRDADGGWTSITATDVDLACGLAVGNEVYLGTDEASVLRVDGGGELERVTDFAGVAGRDKWYAGRALVDGRWMGPPLGVRSMSATADGSVLFANVHVGGIPRSVDRGTNWQATVAIDCDVHEVRVHPDRPEIVAAATAVGLYFSRDGGVTWEVEARGLHALHCSAVAFAGDAVWVSASESPFAAEGAIYRRGVDEPGPLVKVGGGLPEWLEGRVDTRCIAVGGASVALTDGNGNLYASDDYGRNWSRVAAGLSSPSSVVLV